MSLVNHGLTAFLLVNVLLLVLLCSRPRLTAPRGGRILAFLIFFVFPVLAAAAGGTLHLNQSKSTRFCLSCHIMEPYGASLRIDAPEPLPAAHYQNHRIPWDEACYTCHTSYTLFGGLQAKLRGVRHLYVNFLTVDPGPPHLYEPYSNRECLHCHDGARSFVESEGHAGLLTELDSDAISCLECHDVVHDIEHLAALPLWEETD